MTKLNRRSHIITEGVARSPNRAMLRAVGFTDSDFEKPIVGVANGHSNMNPCNAGIQPLVDRAMAALKEAGAIPQVFGFPTVTDGIAMGTEGMKYSLVSREVIADAIEDAVNGQCMDGSGLRRLRQEHAGRHDRDRAHERAGDLRLCGHHKARQLEGAGPDDREPFEAVGAFAAGKMTEEDFIGIEKNACPSVGACGGSITANTMSSSFEALGMSVLGSSQMASPDRGKGGFGSGICAHLVDAVRNESAPARHHHQEGDRERGRADHGNGRFDQCRPALSRHCQCGGGEMDDR